MHPNETPTSPGVELTQDVDTSADDDLPALSRLNTVAHDVIAEHARTDDGRCIGCGAPWPCELVSTATWTIELLSGVVTS